jgi:hypothetical protein
MKLNTLIFTTVAVALTLPTSNAKAVPAIFQFEKLNFTLTATQQKLDNSETSPNVFVSTVQTFKIGNKDLLSFLAMAFNTNWPAGAQLAMEINSGDMFVVDETGTNWIADVSNAGQGETNFGYFTVGSNSTVFSGKAENKQNGGSQTQTSSGKIFFHLYYQQDGIITTDLYFDGLGVSNFSKKIVNTTETMTRRDSIPVTGDGTFNMGIWTVVNGGVTGSGKWVGPLVNFPTSGLVLFAKFSEGSGNTVADSSGNGHTGYLANSPAWIPGVTDYALNFVSASQQSVGFGNLNLAGSNQCTFAMWMQKTNPADIGLAALGCTSGTYNAIFLTWWNDGYVYGGVGYTNAFRYFYAPYVANTWMHFVMVYDGTQLQNSNRINIFINGVQATPSPDQSFALTAISTNIGAVSTNFSLSWDSNEGYESGRYDGVGVWNRALSATEIQQVYRNAAAGP